jgi:hypothetical protein
LKPSAEPLWPGLLGLALAAWGIIALAHYRLQERDLEAALRLGYARPAATLSKSEALSRGDSPDLGWLSPLDRAFKIQLSAADRLRIDVPQEQDLILLESDVMPQARYRLAEVPGGWEIQVRPWQGQAWSAPSNSGGRVGPAVYPANGRVAYYDLNRIWIADLNGLKMQSLQHVPLLQDGGQLFWDYGGTRLCWMGSLSGAAAVDLTVEDAWKP